MDWEKKEKSLCRDFKFKDFTQALEFVNQVVEIAESLNHHPDILIYSYNNVKISTYTHSEDKITQKDYLLSEKINELSK